MTFNNQEIEITIKYKPVFEEYINILNMLNDNEQNKQNYQKQLIYNKKDFKNSELLYNYNIKSKSYYRNLFWIIFIVLECFTVFVTFKNIDIGIIDSIFIFVIMTILFFLSAGVISFIVSIVLKFIKKKLLYKQALKNLPSVEQTISNLERKADTLQDNKNNIERLLSESEVPPAYWIFGVEIITLLENKRANSITDAINLLEDIMYKIRMEIAAINNIQAINNVAIQTQMVRESINRIYIPNEFTVRIK